MSASEKEVFAGTRNAFIRESFRDTADHDYIAARVLHRHQLLGQFLWLGLQAVEKYLKAIILFNDGDTRNINHDIEKALEQAEKIERLGMTISDRSKRFIQYLNGQGGNRYFTWPRFVKGKELCHLDHTVWQLRRYCDDFFYPWDHPILLERQKSRLEKAHRERDRDKNWATCRLDQRGFLEQVLDTGKHKELRRDLVWKNFYFGGVNRNKIFALMTEHWTLPSNLVYPEILDWARDRVRLHKGVIAEMEKRLREQQLRKKK